MRRFHHRGEVYPSVVVHVDRCDAPRSRYVVKRQSHSFEVGSIDILPESETGTSGMGHRNIHPSVFVEVQNRETVSWCELTLRIERGWEEVSLARIHVKGDAVLTCNRDIDGTV